MQLEPIQKLTKDLKEASYRLSDQEARYLVDAYYTMQDNRIRSAAQVRETTKTGEPNSVLVWLETENRRMENEIKKALSYYTDAHIIGEWMKSIKGIGPVISAGMLAHIDIHKAPTVGHIWSFAGLDPRAEWKKGQKRPWNAQLKVLCWKAGQSFVKVSGDESAFYGQIYKNRKAYEMERNERGDNAAAAAKVLEKKNIGKDTEAYRHYSAGKLPPAHIQARAERYAVKFFLSHLHETWRKAEGLDVPKPFAISHLGHAHYVGPDSHWN